MYCSIMSFVIGSSSTMASVSSRIQSHCNPFRLTWRTPTSKQPAHQDLCVFLPNQRAIIVPPPKHHNLIVVYIVDLDIELVVGVTGTLSLSIAVVFAYHCIALTSKLADAIVVA
jgi:hypothetical protein